MGAALELVTGFVTAPGAVQTNLTMAVGNALTIRNCPFDKTVRLLTLWAQNQVAGIARVRSPKMHDNVQGIRERITTADTSPRIPLGVGTRLYPQDTLTADLSGSAVGGQIETMCQLIWYEELPGANARLIAIPELMSRGVNELSVETVHAFGAAGGYSGEVAINSSFDLLKANTDYAIVGYNVTAECAAVRWRGADTANLGIGAPGRAGLPLLTSGWFRALSLAFNMPLIPVFNSANKAGFLVDGAQSQAAAAVTMNTCLVELAPGPGR